MPSLNHEGTDLTSLIWRIKSQSKWKAALLVGVLMFVDFIFVAIVASTILLALKAGGF